MSQRSAHPGHRPVAGGTARAAVFGVSDGLVSNVSLILGFAASGVDVTVVRLAGIAGAVAGGISMAAGEWVSVSSQNDLTRRELAVEMRELLNNPENELAELAAIYESNGMAPQQALDAARAVMQDPQAALAVHAREELGIDPNELPSPWSAAIVSLVCFLFGALLPIVPWFVGSGDGATVATVVIGVIAAAVVGAIIGVLSERPVAFTVARQVGIALGACGITYLIGSVVGVNLG
jgi:VIT1/CCC1 family predicted Fe2+/Mn2+ transporter